MKHLHDFQDLTVEDLSTVNGGSRVFDALGYISGYILSALTSAEFSSDSYGQTTINASKM